MMSRNTFPEPQPDSASYADKTDAAKEGGVGQMLTLDDIGGSFFLEMLTMADKGGI